MASKNLVSWLTRWKLFSKLRLALEKGFDPNFVLKPKQIICFEQLINGNDTLAVLPTGYGKSILYQLLPFRAIIEDQQKILSQRGVEVATLTYEREECTEDLFAHLNTEDPVEPNFRVSHEIKNGDIDFLFGHPEAFLSHTGRNLLKSKIYQDNVVACVVDEAHCVELWYIYILCFYIVSGDWNLEKAFKIWLS
ncbi:probable ATP-dependent DNA helicase RecS [Hydractinia symbiolongicarpus]|uniref:probable ATP-dependent DNA helicase RecS n=1 Tax=Hydractinia symbiolongicarpus TaxID=13093 RepID=UPI00254ACFA5|nr:probable ATP-dependent DNA helicase RecS [Hydractinia symbiolongicarpus]